MDRSRELIEAALRGDLPEVQRLVNEGADIHAQNDQALMYAAAGGHLPIVKFLINRGSSSSQVTFMLEMIEL